MQRARSGRARFRAGDRGCSRPTASFRGTIRVSFKSSRSALATLRKRQASRSFVRARSPEKRRPETASRSRARQRLLRARAFGSPRRLLGASSCSRRAAENRPPGSSESWWRSRRARAPRAQRSSENETSRPAFRPFLANVQLEPRVVLEGGVAPSLEIPSGERLLSASARSIQLALKRRARRRTSTRSGSFACASSAAAMAASVLVRDMDGRLRWRRRGSKRRGCRRTASAGMRQRDS